MIEFNSDEYKKISDLYDSFDERSKEKLLEIAKKENPTMSDFCLEQKVKSWIFTGRKLKNEKMSIL